MDAARVLAEVTVTSAVAFLDGSRSAAQLCRAAQGIQQQLLTVHRDAESSELLDPVGLLLASMLQTSRACLPESPVSPERRERWMHIMASFVDLIRAISAKSSGQGQGVA